MKLPVPIFTKSKTIYTDIDIVKPKASVLADTRKAVDNNNTFEAIRIFLAGCTESITNGKVSVTEKVNIWNTVGLMPYNSAEYIIIQIMLLYDKENDAIEGIYKCPRCNTKVISEYLDNDDIILDTRDYISQLDVEYMEEENELIYIELHEPVVLINKSTKEVLETIESFTISYPNLSNCIAASKKYGYVDSIRLQLAMYVEALVKINGKKVDSKYKNMFGMTIFENIKEVKQDLGNLNSEISKYGISPHITKMCPECGKEFKVVINMSNFFVSGLDL